MKFPIYVISVLATGAILSGCGAGGGSIPQDGGPPRVVLTSVPQLGSFAHLKGQVYNVKANTCKIACWIYVANSWWPKPYYAQLWTPIRADGSFETDVTTGGIDEQATELRAYLETNDYSDGLSLPPDPPTAQVLAMASAHR